MTTLTGTDRAAEPGILAAIKAHPGITQDQLAEMVGEPLYRIKRVLSAARAAGQAGFTRNNGEAPRWWAPEVLQQAMAAARIATKEAERIRNQRYYVARRQSLRDELEEPDTLGDAPIRRHVSPHAPLPFKLQAPASVFHLGSML